MATVSEPDTTFTDPANQAASGGGRRRQVEAKNFDDQNTEEDLTLIKSLIQIAWDYALDLPNNASRNGYSVEGASEIKSRCIGVLDVTMEDQSETHLYVIGCSSTGLDDMVAGGIANFVDTWKLCKKRIENAIEVDSRYIYPRAKCIVADVGPSTQCYCAIPSTKPLSEFGEDEQKAYWAEIQKRLMNRKTVLEKKFFKQQQQGEKQQQQDIKLCDDQLKELKALLKRSVFGVKFEVDQLPEKDFEELVVWHRDLIEVDKIINIFIELAKVPYEEVIPYLCDKVKLLKGKEKLLYAATYPCPKNKEELKKRLEILGLCLLNREGMLLNICMHVCFKPNLSRLADYYAQCAEDNATIELMKYLESNPSKKVKSVDWFSTEWSKSGAIVHKPLCAVCAIRFMDRLEWLLSSRDKIVHASDTTRPDINTTYNICEIDIEWSKIFIDGTWQDSTSGAKYNIIKPCTWDKICDVAKGNKEDVDKAVAAAHMALQDAGSQWHTMEASQRGNLLNKLADLIERDSEFLAHLETMSNRRPLPDTYLPDVVDCYRYFAWLATMIHGGTLPDDGPYRCFTKEPVGVVGLIISGDFPLLMQAWTLGPALSAGNTVVITPAIENPLTSLYIASLINEAVFPTGVVNVVTGGVNTAGVAMANHPDINKVAFVGSRDVGHQMLSEAGRNSLKEKKVTMMLHKEGADICETFNMLLSIEWKKGGLLEVPLSGKGSTIIFIFADVELDDVIRRSFFANHFIFSKDRPLPCTFVQESIYDEFVKKVRQKAIKYYVNIKLETKFNGIANTIFWQTGTADYPVMKILRFQGSFPSFPNNSPMYDIAAAIFTTNVENAMKVVESLHVTTVWINCYDAFCHQIPLQGKMQALVSSRRSPLVQDKNFDQEGPTSTIRHLFKAIWKSARQVASDHNGHCILDSISEGIGVLDVTMDDQTHLYVIASSMPTGQTDLLLEETVQLRKGCMERISKAIGGPNLGIECIIADVGQSTQWYFAVDSTKSVTAIKDEMKQAYQDAIKYRMKNYRIMLRNILQYNVGALTDDQCIKLQEVLKDSVFGVYDVLQKDLTEVVDWHKKLIEQDDTIDGNLRHADYFAQCAEDNATISLMEYLKNNPSKRVASVDWFGTQWSKGDVIVHKPLCGVCAIRFKDRLELLLLMSSRDIKYNKIFIENKWKNTISGDTYPIINPSTWDNICDVAKGNKEDVGKAVAAAHNALQPWYTMEALQRSNFLYKLADLIERDSEYLAYLETMGNRRPLTNKYLPDVIQCYRYFAYRAVARTFPDDGPYRCFTKEPVGVVGQIISGNFPLLKQAYTLGPALCAGNTVVITPAKENPLTSLYIASLIAEAGFPTGVVNIVTGDVNTTGVAMATHPNINKVVFVGSTEVGHQMLSEAGGNSLKEKKITMMLHKEGADICATFNLMVNKNKGRKHLIENVTLNGKGSTVCFVFADADIDNAINKIWFALRFPLNKDQPIPYTFVEQSVYNNFVSKSITEARNYLKGYIKFDKCTMSIIVGQEKQPVMKILIFNGTFPRLPNNSPMCDIAAAIFTTNVENAMKVVESLHASTVWINCCYAFCHQALLQGMLMSSRRSPLIIVDQEGPTSSIRHLVEAVWGAALHNGHSEGSKVTFKDKCIGVLDVTMEDHTHLYVIASSMTGQKDLILEEMVQFAVVWKGCTERISKAIRDLNLDIKFHIADIRPSPQCYCAVPFTRAVSEFDDEKKMAYQDAIKYRMKNCRIMLRNILQYNVGALTDDQCIKLQEVLKDSVFGVYDVLQKDLTEVVDWHKKLIEQDDTIDGNLRLADYFAQCAEDNATIALMEYLKNNYPSKRVASVDWFGTEWSEDGTIVHKPLCGVCAIRFKDRLELLLLMSSRDVKYNKIFIENKWKNTISGDTYPIINPSTGNKICDVAKCNKEVVYKAVAAARKALQPSSPWHTMTASQRGNLLNKLADLIERDSEYLTHLETMNSGRVCSKDLPRVIKYYRDFAQTTSQNTHEPVGIEGHINSGDFPFLMQAWVLGSTLCRGNTVILKPAEQTPLSSLYVASLTVEAGFPPGVVSIVPGVGSTVGDALATYPDIIFAGHPKGHIIIAANTNLNDVIKECIFRTHIYVTESRYDEFVMKSVEFAKGINPLDPANDLGPFYLDIILRLIENAKNAGAKLQWGGKRHGDQGYFIEPTILSDVTEDMQIAKEIFGPVMIITKYNCGFEEALKRAYR